MIGVILKELFKNKFDHFINVITEFLDLKSDFDELGTYSLIVGGVEFKSGNAWGLIFAIFIASIGLNVNSTAVIIGAMLISPLMGPIVGAGFSIGTHDFKLLKKSLVNLFYATLISIISSTLFFVISPSGSSKSELLARTQPTIFDVLIAFFGGAAGIVAITRKNRGNAVPGVAIATALMPPLCTVGYGIANLELKYIIGALYLFCINAVFILVATYLFTRLLGFHLKSDRTTSRDRIIHRYMTWGSVLLIVPSIGVAWYLQRKTQFENSANNFINSEFNLSSAIIAKKEIAYDLNKSSIHLYLFGEELSQTQKEVIEKKMKSISPLKKTILKISVIKNDNFPISELEEKFIKRSEISQILKIENSKKLKLNEEKISDLKLKLIQDFRDLIVDLYFHEGDIKIIWSKKPSPINRTRVELEIANFILDKKVKFYHSILMR